MRFSTKKDFISEAERLVLLEWFDANANDETIFRKGISRGVWGYSLSRTSRQNRVIPYPALMNVIFSRIIEAYGLDGYARERVGTDGMICMVNFPDGDIYLHTDPKASEECHAVSFNIIVQAPEHGGILYIGDQLYHKDLDERELHAYVASKHQHMVTKCEGSKNRYILICRMALPDGVWE